MNIKEAKEQVKNAITAYFTKDAFGGYVIPIEKQRPVFLMGPPGIGKTAIIEQIAQELDVAVISYSMTHHTRQSALGLPFIEKKIYGGKEYAVSEYTMSEIIASVYDVMEKTGKKEGILFLDEINCVSETLAPSMLQFLQYKVFGRHRVPDGWIIVTAGNPPEYNNSVREFDIVTLDRLKRIDIEPDFDAWREFSANSGVHPAILTYLDIKKTDFYKIESSVDGKTFVTARGWSDLSDMIRLYEQHNIPVKEELVIQYLQNRKIAKDFAAYYDLFNKYRSDYQVDRILNGTAEESIVERARKAKFDERLSLLGLIIDAVNEPIEEVTDKRSILVEFERRMVYIKDRMNFPKMSLVLALEEQIAGIENDTEKGLKAGSIDKKREREAFDLIEMLREAEEHYKNDSESKDLTFMRKAHERDKDDLKKAAEIVKRKFENVFSFFENAFGGDSKEMLILLERLTQSGAASDFISHYGCDAYFKFNEQLLFFERQNELTRKIKEIGL